MQLIVMFLCFSTDQTDTQAKGLVILSTINLAAFLLCQLFKVFFKLFVSLIAILLWFLQVLYSILENYSPTISDKPSSYHSLPFPTQETLQNIKSSHQPAEKISFFSVPQDTSEGPLPFRSPYKYHRSKTIVFTQRLTTSSLEETPSKLTALSNEIECIQQDFVTESNRLAHYKEELVNIIANMFPVKALKEGFGPTPIDLQEESKDKQTSEFFDSLFEMHDTNDTTQLAIGKSSAEQSFGKPESKIPRTDRAKDTLTKTSVVLQGDTKTDTAGYNP